MKIGTKLIGGFLVVALLVGIVGWSGINASNQASLLYAELGGDFAPFTKAATEITSFSKRAEGHLSLYLMFGNRVDRDKFFSRHEALNGEIAVIEMSIKGQEEEAIIDNLKSQSADILKYGEALLQERDKDPQGFDIKEHEVLMRDFYKSTSGARKSGMELAKNRREIFLNQRAVDLNTEITSFSKRAESHLSLYLMFGDQVDRDKFFSRQHQLGDTIKQLEDVITKPEDNGLVNKMKSQSADILKYGEALLQERDKDPQGFDIKEHEVLMRDFYKSTSGARKSGVELAKAKSDAIADQVGTVAATVSNIQRTILVLIIIAVFGAIGMGFLISNSISKPITKLRDTAREIGKGGLGTKIDVKSKDEIGELASSFNQMTKNLKQSRTEVEKYSKTLEKQVNERTKQLEAKVDELERLHQLSVGRELRMIELKKRIKELGGE